MNIPAPLEAEPDFMLLYRAALLGTNDADRRQIDNLIALAFLKGQVEGAGEAVKIFRGPSVTNAASAQ